MYVPAFNAVTDDAELRAMVAAVGSAQLITVGVDGVPLATLLPIVWTGDTVFAHLARANPHWRQVPDDAPTLLVCAGPQTYVSPSWYAAKAEHGRVVPTWNYTAVHLTGTARIHDDPEWLRTVVTDLTVRHEQSRDEPWAVTDAPPAYLVGQLRAIVGIEIAVRTVEGKAKLSQNRSSADRAGVIAGLQHDGTPEGIAVASVMDAGA